MDYSVVMSTTPFQLAINHLTNQASWLKKNVQTKCREYGNFKFSGVEIESIQNGYKIHQSSFANKISELELSSNFSSFRSKRQELAWLTNTRPDIACAVNKAAQVTEENFSTDHIKLLNKVVKTAKKYSNRGLTQQKLDIETLRMVVYTDAAFATNSDHLSQLGYLILLCDGKNNCNILHYSSSKSKRVARSVLGSEIYAFADGFDFAYSLRTDIQNITKKIFHFKCLRIRNVFLTF